MLQYKNYQTYFNGFNNHQFSQTVQINDMYYNQQINCIQIIKANIHRNNYFGNQNQNQDAVNQFIINKNILKQQYQREQYQREQYEREQYEIKQQFYVQEYERQQIVQNQQNKYQEVLQISYKDNFIRVKINVLEIFVDENNKKYFLCVHKDIRKANFGKINVANAYFREDKDKDFISCAKWIIRNVHGNFNRKNNFYLLSKEKDCNGVTYLDYVIFVDPNYYTKKNISTFKKVDNSLSWIKKENLDEVDYFQAGNLNENNCIHFIDIDKFNKYKDNIFPPLFKMLTKENFFEKIDRFYMQEHL